MARANQAQQSLRIIAGEWRGRKLPFPAVEGLRPTSDRVRETLFNWLQGHSEGAHVLDVFAGSGALSLESLSRGAKQVLAFERSAVAVTQLVANARTLSAQGLCVEQVDAYARLRQGNAAAGFDLVFLDPPFAHAPYADLVESLRTGGWLSPNAWVYIERARGVELALPQGWTLYREKQAGGVVFGLWRVE